MRFLGVRKFILYFYGAVLKLPPHSLPSSSKEINRDAIFQWVRSDKAGEQYPPEVGMNSKIPMQPVGGLFCKHDHPRELVGRLLAQHVTGFCLSCGVGHRSHSTRL